MRETINEIDKRLEQLRARRSLLLARETIVQRKLRTRQAAILGGWILAHRPDLATEIKMQLVRKQDLAAFGLHPTEASVERHTLDGINSPEIIRD